MKLSRTLIVLDLETTGTWIDQDKIIEIALIKCLSDGSRETYLKRINPTIPIPQEVVALVGISNEDVSDAPLFCDVAKEILEFIGDADLAGFNIEKFDLPLLAREMSEAGLSFDYRTRRIIDAQTVYHINERRDLTAAYKFYCKKDLENAHSALADTEATLEIIEQQIVQYGEGNDELDVLRQFQYRRDNNFFDDDRKFRWWNGKLYMMFGKYARKYSLQDIAKMDRKYLEWILSADFSEDVKNLIKDALIGKFPVADSAFGVDEKGQGNLF